MKQLILGGPSQPITNATSYASPLAYSWSNLVAANVRSQPITTPGRIRSVYVTLSAAPGAGTSYTFSLQVNGVDTGVSVQISGLQTEGFDNTNVFAVAQGQRLGWRCVPAGVPAPAMARVSFEFEGNINNESCLFCYADTNPAGVRYAPISSDGLVSLAVEEDCVQIIPTFGILKNLFVNLSSNPGGAGTGRGYRVTIRINGVDTALSVTIMELAVDGNNTADEVHVSPGDKVTVSMTPIGGTVSAPDVRMGTTFRAAIDGESIWLGGDSTPPSILAVEYNRAQSIYYGSNWLFEATVRQRVQDYFARKLYVRITAAPGVGRSYTFTVRQNGADTPLSCIVADVATTGNNIADTVDFAHGDYVALQSTPAGNPAACDVKWGMVVYYLLPGSPTVTTLPATGVY